MAFIVRIDKPKNGPGGTHGWQVRSRGKRGYHSKLFSDGKYGSKGKALVAAEEYLEAYLKEHPDEKIEGRANQPFHRGKLHSHNTSGVTGVYTSHDYAGWDKKKQNPLQHWSAFCPVGPNGKRFTKSFYINTYGEAEAKRLAIEFRKMWEEAVLEGEEALQEFFQREHFDKIDPERLTDNLWD